MPADLDGGAHGRRELEQVDRVVGRERGRGRRCARSRRHVQSRNSFTPRLSLSTSKWRAPFARSSRLDPISMRRPSCDSRQLPFAPAVLERDRSGARSQHVTEGRGTALARSLVGDGEARRHEHVVAEPRDQIPVLGCGVARGQTGAGADRRGRGRIVGRGRLARAPALRARARAQRACVSSRLVPGDDLLAAPPRGERLSEPNAWKPSDTRVHSATITSPRSGRPPSGADA